MLLGVGLAFLSTRTDMPGGRFIGILTMLPMLVPPFILVVGWVALADPNAGFINILASAINGSRTSWVNISTMPGLIWMTGSSSRPMSTLLVAAGFKNSDASMEEAARVRAPGGSVSFTA
jgi:iron(III) transport system permease protein